MKKRVTPIPAAFHDADATIAVGLHKNADASNYMQWLEDLCRPHLGDRCLEIGSGHGDLAERLAPGREFVVSDLSESCLAVLKQRFAEAPNVGVQVFDVMDVEHEAEFDTIIMTNVLEHIDDDLEAITKLRRALRPGGRLVVYVPAFPALYSEFDRQLGHCRRYKRRPLEQLLKSADYRIVDSRYVNSIGTFGWWLYCRVLKRAASDDITVDSCDKYVVPAVRLFEDRWRPPFGLSVLCVGERP